MAACGQPVHNLEPLPKPDNTPPPPRVMQVPPKRPAREVFTVPPSPASIVVFRDALVWTDGSGSIWTMPTTGGTPKQLSDGQKPDFAFKVVVAGDAVMASTRKDLLHVDLDGAVTKVNVKGLVELPEEVVADASGVYVTMFKRDQIMHVTGTSAKQIGTLARGVLALRGSTLYAVSYATGALVAIPTNGDKPRTIGKGFLRSTALAVDDTHAFVYSEKAKTISRIDLATGAPTVIAKDLTNADELVLDGDWLYTRSWDTGKRGSIVRIAKDGSGQTVLGADLAAPYNIAVDDDAVYVTIRDGAQIVRFDKAAMR
jgi:hypothetical protein